MHWRKPVQARIICDRPSHQRQLGSCATNFFDDLLSEHAVTTDFSKPYPFYLAYAIEDKVKPWVNQMNGRQSGNGMVSAARSSNAITNYLCGAGVKN